MRLLVCFHGVRCVGLDWRDGVAVVIELMIAQDVVGIRDSFMATMCCWLWVLLWISVMGDTREKQPTTIMNRDIELLHHWPNIIR